MPRNRPAAYLGVYDTIILKKEFCNDCQSYSIVRKGILLCCDKRSVADAETWKRESLSLGIRRGPSATYRHEQLDRQGNRCFYCLIYFGCLVEWRGRSVKAKTHWDHFVPYSYIQSNPDENFLASCQICNQIKSSKVFSTVEEVRSYVAIQKDLRKNKMRTLR